MLDSWTRYSVNRQDAEMTTGLVTELAAHGLVLLDGLTNADDLLQLAQSIATIVPHRDSDATGLTTIADIGGHVRSGFARFGACALNPHTDRPGILSPPVLLMMTCGRPARCGGECVVIDGKAVYDDLVESHPKAAIALSAPRSVLFGGAAGTLASVFSTSGNRITIRLRLDDLAKFSPKTTHLLPILRAAIDRHATFFRLDAGQGYILDNHRWLHGRRAFTGQRVMYRVNGNPLPHLGISPGFEPARNLTPSDST